jgi:hypothetical protein
LTEEEHDAKQKMTPNGIELEGERKIAEDLYLGEKRKSKD